LLIYNKVGHKKIVVYGEIILILIQLLIKLTLITYNNKLYISTVEKRKCNCISPICLLKKLYNHNDRKKNNFDSKEACNADEINVHISIIV